MELYRTAKFGSQPFNAAVRNLLQMNVSKNSLIGSENAENSQCNSFFDHGWAVHPLVERSIIVSHRDFDKALLDPSNVYLFTGRGPSTSNMQLGHLIPFMITKYLHNEVFPHSPLFIQLSDDEKYFSSQSTLDDIDQYANNNIRDICAMGFDTKRTFIFKNTSYIQNMYPTALKIQKSLTANSLRNTFGIGESDSVGKYIFPTMQAAPCFSECFQTILNQNRAWRPVVPCALDQDPFFVLTRHIAKKFKKPKPSVLHCGYVPSLKDPTVKMSSSKPENGVIYLTDSKEIVSRKIKGAFSGGNQTFEEFCRTGGNLDRDVAYQLLRYFFFDQEEFIEIGKMYATAQISSLAVKNLATERISAILAEWKERRIEVTDEDVQEIMRERVIG